MKKISLKNVHLKEMEQLSREQLKNVLGGYIGGTGTEGGGTTKDPVSVPCKCDDGREVYVICETTVECVDACFHYCDGE